MTTPKRLQLVVSSGLNSVIFLESCGSKENCCSICFFLYLVKLLAYFLLSALNTLRSVIILHLIFISRFTMKRILILLSFAFVINTSNAQITMGLKLGGHLATSGTALPGFVQIESDGTEKVLIGTMGSGLDLSGMVAFDLTKNVAFGFDVGYFTGFKVKYYQHADINGTGTLSKIDVAVKGTFFNVSPYLSVKASNRNNQGVIPYGRLGLHTGLATVKSTTTISGVQGQSVDRYSGNWSLGLFSAMGLSISINKKASLFSEITIKTIGFRPKELRNIENFEGQDAGKVTRYVKELDPNGPTNNELSFLIPFNSLGLSFGYQYRLGK